MGGIVVLCHGCSHGAPDFWPKSSGCHNCVGLPEEVKIARACVAAGFLAVAISSKDRISKCWTRVDLQRVVKTIQHIQTHYPSASGLPVFAFGASSGGAFVGHLAASGQIELLRGICVQIMGLPAPDQLQVPTMLDHMPLDEHTASAVAADLKALSGRGVAVLETRLTPKVVNATYFSDQIPGFPVTMSAQIYAALRSKGIIDGLGRLHEDPRQTDWRHALAAAPGLSAIDSLEADRSAVAEELNVAWAYHEASAEHVAVMLEFFSNHSSAPPHAAPAPAEHA
eukprot:NODE_1260_length_937_cov_100.299550_g1045_i0.p1 GENE.NODE_1260_length_937_cov_100.299550_g1045_i0~~NODE_1260_length_937_cov_100.299550_g1045_i0.p1  ORF type:complete len:290 (+),score=62.60 NODE_1260_length_937_cov_100.299550_g1045_i0:22-870(+)